MKAYLFNFARLVGVAVFIIFASPTLHAEIVDGYYITKAGDTVRGKIDLPVIRNTNFTRYIRKIDGLEHDVPDESAEIDYGKLTFDFKFIEETGKAKKIDRLKVKGFGFTYKGRQYDFVTWDVKAHKQIYLVSPLGDVVPNGVYFILRSLPGPIPIYSLFQEVEKDTSKLKKTPVQPGHPDTGPSYRREFLGLVLKRDIIFEHPTKGFIYISDQYPMLKKLPDTLKYLELEEEFVKTLTKEDKNLLEIIKKYNRWKNEQQPDSR